MTADSSDIAIECTDVQVEYTNPLNADVSLVQSIGRGLRLIPPVPKYFQALKDVSLKIKKGECLGIFGHNGSGKSTLLKVIAGVIEPKSGAVSAKGIIAPLIELGAGFDPELNGLENAIMCCLLMGVPRKVIDEKLWEIVHFADIGDFMYGPVKIYSSGMYMRLGFACSTVINPDILLVDEILAVGDAAFQAKCLARVRQVRDSGNTIVLVSHDVSQIKSICTRALVCWEGRIVFDGPVDSASDIYLSLMDGRHKLSSISEIVSESLRKAELNASFKTLASGTVGRVEKVTVDYKVLDGRPTLNVAVLMKNFCQHTRPMVLGFQIKTPSGIRVFGTNTRTTKSERDSAEFADLLTKPNDLLVHWSLDCSALTPGTYHFDTCISDYEVRTPFEFLDSAATFTVPGEPKATTDLVAMPLKNFSITAVPRHL